MHCLLTYFIRSIARKCIWYCNSYPRIIYRVSRAENESKASLNHVLDDLYRLSLEIVLLLPLLPPPILPFLCLSWVDGSMNSRESSSLSVHIRRRGTIREDRKWDREDVTYRSIFLNIANKVDGQMAKRGYIMEMWMLKKGKEDKKKKIMEERKEVYRYWNKWRNVEGCGFVAKLG